MPKNLEQSYAAGFVHRINTPATPRYMPYTRVLEGGRYLLQQQPFAIFRSLMNSVMAAAEVNVGQAIDSGELDGDPTTVGCVMDEICISAAKAHRVITRGNQLACEGVSLISVDGHIIPEILRPAILGKNHTLLGSFVAPLYKPYQRASEEVLLRYSFQRDDSLLCETVTGGVLLLSDAQVFETSSGQLRHEYENVVVPLNEPAVQIYRATEIL